MAHADDPSSRSGQFGQGSGLTVMMISAANSIHTVRWANAYVERGLSVDLVSQHAPLAGLSSAVRVHQLPHYDGLGYVLNGSRVRRLVEQLQPDVVNVHYATGYGTLARSCGHAPVVLNVWGSDVYAFPAKSSLHRWWLRRNLRDADRIVSTSEAMAHRTRSICPGLSTIAIVPFGVDTEVFKPAPEKAATGTVVIGTVKTLEPVYGVDLMVTAFLRLCAMDGLPKLRLRIVGDGAERSRLEELVRAAGAMANVDFVGKVPHAEVPKELAKLDIYVALSREESFGVAVLEASSCAVPVVVSDAGGLPEVVQNGVTGIVVPRGNVEAAADALHRLVLDAGLRTSMGTAGREWVKSTYAWPVCVDRMLNVLQETANTQR